MITVLDKVLMISKESLRQLLIQISIEKKDYQKEKKPTKLKKEGREPQS